MPHLRNELEQYLRQCFNDLLPPWREYLKCVTPNLDAVRQDVLLHRGEEIIPRRQDDGRGALFALRGPDLANVAVVVIGKEPYANPDRATGRSFEQGDLTDWSEDLQWPYRVVPSLLNLVRAAAALHPCAAGLRLDDQNLQDKRKELRCFHQNNCGVLRSPESMFDDLTERGVLWLNRTPTMSSRPVNPPHQGRSWECIEEQQRWHRALWDPIMCSILSRLVDEALTRPIVFALFGKDARELKPCIEARRQWRCVPSDHIRFVLSGHPAARQGEFFARGNPLRRINDKLTLCDRGVIDWCSRGGAG